jgi:multiple sugar transport system substrate-binding protein
MRPLRIAVRKFDPFEAAIRRQFDDFARTVGGAPQLEIEALELNELHARLLAQPSLRDGSIDLAFLCTDWLAEAHAAGAIENLRPYQMRAPISDFPHAWSPSLVTLQDFAGGFWGMPYHDGPQCLIYRKDLLEAADLEVPRTWEQFHTVARALHDPARGLSGTVLALFPDGHNGFYDFCIQVWSRGGEPFGPGARPQLCSAPAEAALEFMRHLAGDSAAIVPGARALDSVKSGLLFCAGRVALMANWFGFAALAQRWEGSAVRDRVAIAPLPQGLGGRSVSLNVFWVIALAAGSTQKSLAWAFLRHLATAPMDKLTTLEGAIGVRRSTWADAQVNQMIPFYHQLEGLHGHARELPLHPRLAEASHVIDELLARALDTEESSRSLLNETQRRLEEILQ